MSEQFNILILGASYGSLLATKFVFAGHNTDLVCLPNEAELFNAEGAIVRMPIRGIETAVVLRSQDAKGNLAAYGPGEVDPANYDLVCLAMQEPQYRVAEIRELLARVAKAAVPCMSIMNMPPLPFLARIPGLDTTKLQHCYADPSVWDDVDPDLFTLASPDPQAFRPPDEPVNVLQVSLPTNFKVARFTANADTEMLQQVERDIEAIRVVHDGDEIALPVKLRVHDSIFVPLAKWSMLLTGNYRCVQDTEMRAICDAVHSDIELSRSVYEWVGKVCEAMGASPADLVPFDKYANAAKGLSKPSSAARALAAGAPFIERVDALVSAIATTHGMIHPEVEASRLRVEEWLTRNRKA